LRVPQDERFRAEARRIDLRWNCEDCALFDPIGECVHGYPVRNHLRARYEDPAADLLFCKDFDLI